MGYDKENIEGAKEQGLFDSGFDPQVLALDDDEKKRMAARFQDSGDEEAESGPGDEGQDSSPAQQMPVKGAEELGFIGKLFFFIQHLFTGISREEYMKKRELSHIRRIVHSYRPSLYQFGSGQLNSHFANMVYRLAAQCAGFKKIYGACKSNDSGQALGKRRSLLEFLVDRFSGEVTDIEGKLDYTFIRNNPALFTEKNIKDTIEKEVNSALASIGMDTRQYINEMYANLLGYERLSNFNFYLLLRKFGENFSREHEGLPQFASAPGRDVLKELLRLENYLYSIDQTLDMNPIFEALLIFYRSLDGISNDPAVQNDMWSQADFEKLSNMVQDFLRGDKLTNLIRVITQDPQHLPNVRRQSISVVDDYRDSLIKRLLPKCRAIVHQIAVDDLNSKIRNLFGDDPLESIEFYNETTNARLSEMGLPIFVNCRYLQIVKSYYKRLFNPLIKPALNAVVVDGDFLDKRLYSYLSDFFYKFDEAYEDLADFESKVSTASKEGEKLQSLFARYSGDLPTKKVLTNKIHFLNNLSAKALRGIGELLRNAVPALEAIGKDANSGKKPEFIVNIRQIGGSRNKAILKAVKKSEEASSLVYGILKDFMES